MEGTTMSMRNLAVAVLLAASWILIPAGSFAQIPYGLNDPAPADPDQLSAVTPEQDSQGGARFHQAPPVPLTYENQTFTEDVEFTLLEGQTLVIKNCTFQEVPLHVYGDGDVYVRDCSFIHSPTVGIAIMITGYMEVTSVTIHGTGLIAPDGFQYSGLTIHGAGGGGLISDVAVSDFVGNGILLEATIPIADVTLYNNRIENCSGGMWLFGTDGCVVDGLTTYDSDYPPAEAHEEGQIYPCVRDEIVNPADPDAPPLRGNTTFASVECL
jgi:hypothetical protein